MVVLNFNPGPFTRLLRIRCVRWMRSSSSGHSWKTPALFLEIPRIVSSAASFVQKRRMSPSCEAMATESCNSTMKKCFTENPLNGIYGLLRAHAGRDLLYHAGAEKARGRSNQGCSVSRRLREEYQGVNDWRHFLVGGPTLAVEEHRPVVYPAFQFATRWGACGFPLPLFSMPKGRAGRRPFRY